MAARSETIPLSTRAREEVKVKRVLEAGLKAPCNAHLRYWEFILLQDPLKRREAIVESLRARDLKDKVEMERFIAPLCNEVLKEVYRSARGLANQGDADHLEQPRGPE